MQVKKKRPRCGQIANWTKTMRAREERRGRRWSNTWLKKVSDSYSARKPTFWLWWLDKVRYQKFSRLSLPFPRTYLSFGLLLLLYPVSPAPLYANLESFSKRTGSLRLFSLHYRHSARWLKILICNLDIYLSYIFCVKQKKGSCKTLRSQCFSCITKFACLFYLFVRCFYTFICNKLFLQVFL